MVQSGIANQIGHNGLTVITLLRKRNRDNKKAQSAWWGLEVNSSKIHISVSKSFVGQIQSQIRWDPCKLNDHNKVREL